MAESQEPVQPGLKKKKKRVTGSLCAVPECATTYGKNCNEFFHDFPDDPTLRGQWLQAIRREVGKSFHITENVTKVCGAHFVESDFKPATERAVRRRLKEGKGGTPKKKLQDHAVPSVFSFHSTATKPKPRKPPAKRQLPSSSSSEYEETAGDVQMADQGNTELKDRIGQLEDENEQLGAKVRDVEMKLEHEARQSTYLTEQMSDAKQGQGRFDIHRFSAKGRMVHVFTGFFCIAAFMACFKFLQPDAAVMYSWQGGRTKFDMERKHAKSGPQPKLSLEEQFFFVCVRLRTKQTLDELEDRFNVDTTTLSRYFTSWINLMYHKFKELLVFPSRRRVNHNMPQCFKSYYPTTRIIIDCTEFFVEQPSAFGDQQAAFSQYKNQTTAKSPVGISPDGAFTFVSCLFEGSISDRDIVVESGLIPHLEHGDSVMADKGFRIQDLLDPHGVRLNIPPFNTKAHQMLPQDAVTTKSIASVRIHVERAIERLKEYRLLSDTIDNNLYDLLEQCVFCACMLCNFKPALVAR